MEYIPEADHTGKNSFIEQKKERGTISTSHADKRIAVAMGLSLFGVDIGIEFY